MKLPSNYGGKAESKRLRGRPRKARKFDWLRNNLSELPHASLEIITKWVPNITEETHAQYKLHCEEDRRAKVSDKVIKAYGEGRNTANINRHNKKLHREAAIKRDNLPLISNRSLTTRAVALRIMAAGTSQGLGISALWRAVQSIRDKMFARPNRKENR